MHYTFTPEEMTFLRAEAEKRKPFQGGASTFNQDCHLLGVMGEWAFGKIYGLMPNLKALPGGDGGIDFDVQANFSLDVKTGQKPTYLIHRIDRTFADLYVLARGDIANCLVTFYGWHYGALLRHRPTRDFGYGVESHFIPNEELLPMATLKSRLIGGNKQSI